MAGVDGERGGLSAVLEGEGWRECGGNLAEGLALRAGLERGCLAAGSEGSRWGGEGEGGGKGGSGGKGGARLRGLGKGWGRGATGRQRRGRTLGRRRIRGGRGGEWLWGAAGGMSGRTGGHGGKG
uniref:Uncharacterized protein n=1 Tax=Nelumbo nucifera TaxID=4432 RepID=A0A822XHZ8_NELNU|nr:TPA_asm: hypothetical protein HUJ06_020089 [Nelumbo nucifera]